MKKNISSKDFPLNTKKSNISEIILTGRYPEKGSVLNTKSEMVVYILKGKITLNLKTVKINLKSGSVVLIKINEEYYWESKEKTTLLIFSTPPWTSQQQRRIDHVVYILKCSDDSLYVGCTNNLEKRFLEHNTSKNGAHYTKIRRPVILVYSEKFETLKEGRAREAEIKRMKREEKLELIKKFP